MEKMMRPITPFLWFNDNAEDAVNVYTSIFPQSKINSISRYGDDFCEKTGRPAGSIMTIDFEINGQPYVALNGGPMFQFNESVSFVVNCDSQDEVDLYWDQLSAGGDEKAQRCGWLKDKFGLSWQIVPAKLIELLNSENPDGVKRVVQSMMEMTKLDINILQQEYEETN
jgi:predicted 3-demethylubiquinone-9 3-methyltransferase (glyoxalase superfamily)